MAAVGNRRRRGKIERLDTMPGAAPEMISTRIDEDPAEPRFELGRVAKGAALPPSDRQRILRRVLSLLVVAEYCPREAVRRVEMMRRELRKSVHRQIAIAR